MRKIRQNRSLVMLVPLVLVLFLGGAIWLMHTPVPSQKTLPGALLVPVLLALLMGGTVLIVGSLLALGGLASYIVHTLIQPQRRAARWPEPERVFHLPAERVSFPASHGRHLVYGLYIARPGATTTILVSPGYRRGLKDILEVCKPLWDHGHHVLAFEYYGHGSVIGVPITLGHREVQDFLGAVAYAKQRDPRTHIGAIGYSMGAAVTIMGAARTQDVEAVVADSAFASHWSAVELAVHRAFRRTAPLPRQLLALLYLMTDHLLWWRAGYRFHQVQPYQEVAKIAPRPLLLIHGTNDTVVSPDDATCLYEAAQSPKALWLIEGAEHIKGYLVDRQTYLIRVLAFFEQAFSGVSACQQTQHALDPSTERPAEKHTDALQEEDRWSQAIHAGGDTLASF
jgi:fermentation-respiration switch protein FrsA (DUF1100 family)